MSDAVLAAVDAYEAALRIVQQGRRAAVGLPVVASVAICQRLVALEHVAADTFELIALLRRLPGSANPAVIPDIAPLIEAIVSNLSTIGYMETPHGQEQARPD
jgi:hypothetical protein